MNTVNLQMPNGIVLDETVSTETFGRFIVQPLEKGYGVTLGNAFRRVLLSSIPGYAITSFKLDGVLHEFTTAKGIVEDIAEVVLNLKEVRLKETNRKVGKVSINLKGLKSFTAADIETACPDVEILNPKLHIASLTKDVNLTIELRIGRGKGYVTSEENKSVENEIGIIAIDSIFSPVTNTKYTIEQTRVGQQSDYEKLILDVTTDGSISPTEALTQASKILRDHIQFFLSFGGVVDTSTVGIVKDEEFMRVRKLLMTKVEDLELSVRSHNCLKAASINTISDLVSKQESELLQFRNFGRKSLAELGQMVEQNNLNFGMDVDKYLKESD